MITTEQAETATRSDPRSEKAAASEQDAGVGDCAPAAKGRTQRGQRAKPAAAWLTDLLAPHASILRGKAWLDVAAGLMSIPQAALLGFGLEALIVEGVGVAGLVPYVLGLIVTVSVRAGLTYLAGLKGHQVSSAIRHGLRLALATSLAEQSPVATKRPSAGEVAALGSNVIEALDAYISRYLSLKLQLAVVPLVILLVVALHSWVAALILMVCGPLIPVFMALIGLRAKKASDAQIAALSDMSARFLDRVSGMTTLRLFHAVQRTRAEFDDLANTYRQASMRVLRIAFLSSAALEFFAALGIALTAIYVAYHYLGSSDFGHYGVPIGLGTGILLLSLATEFFAPLREFSAAYHDKATAEAAADRLRGLLTPTDQGLNFADVPRSHDRQDAPPVAVSDICLEACSFAYGDARNPALTNASCRFKQGERIALIGASGAGKSTLLAALCGLLDPISGRLMINGETPSEEGLSWSRLRASIAYIGQRPHIFHGSVLSNVRLAAPQADRESATKALVRAHADEFVSQLPRGPITILGEAGFGISGGQVRRLAIARAMLSPASVLLCDEPTADLDAETADGILDSLMEAARDRMLIVATHDRAVARRCDRILLVADGQLREIAPADLDRLTGGLS